MSSDSDDDSNNGNYGADLTGILFGNIDSTGRLESDLLDNETKNHLSSLARLGLDSILQEVIDEEQENSANDDADDEEDLDYDQKDDNAIDYSDINELADEINQMPPPSSYTNSGDDYDLDDIISSNKITPNNISMDSDRRSTDEASDKDLMPPPSIPIKPSSSDPKMQVDTSSGDEALKNDKTQEVEKKLTTPLAAMLPSKYANVDVRDIFPDFRPDKVLRFSRLFGPGKPSSLPQIWRSVRRRRRKRHSIEWNKHHRDGSDSTSDTDEPRSRGWSIHFGPDLGKDHWNSDDEDKLLREVVDDGEEKKQESGESGDNKQKVADWRFGPAQVWYDMLDVNESGEGFNYGFKMRDKLREEDEDSGTEIVDPIPEDAYLMVSQLHWEDDVVWDGNDIKHKVNQKLNSKTNAAGWLPSSGSRTAGAFSQPGKGMPVTPVIPGSKIPINPVTGKMSKTPLLFPKQEETDDTWYSIFPVENEELVYSKWEDEVIWDAEAMTKVPKPKVLTLDPNDENIILGIPDDIDPSKIQKNLGPQPKIKIPHPHVKKSKILLGKAGVINVLAEDTPPPPPKSPDRDPFNISNDVFYAPKSSETTMRLKVGGGNLIQHSTPIVELRAPHIPTHMGPMKLRAFHRPPMKKYSHGPLASLNAHPVMPLLKHIQKKKKQRELERVASGGGDVFFMRAPDDLTGRDGEIILIEFCEEHPPLMNQVGMCSKIKNYYKRKAEKDTAKPTFKYGELAFAHTSPFLGILHPGQYIQAVENNMYRAPIYPHQIYDTDFLVIRTRNNYFIREIDALFTAGQQCPLYEVPGPNSKRANNFVRDFLQVFIYRLFWKSGDNPRRIRMDDIKRAFPAHSESSIRKRLKPCADFKRTGMDSNWWVIKPDFRLPSEEEIRAMVSPEQCCAYFSMIAAEQRLKDAGYGEKSIFAQHDDDDEEMQLKMDDEVKVAPWNTTRAYIQAMRGKCLLQLTGPADPTGCGEGFSYVRVPNKPTQTKEEQKSQPKRTVNGTDADLRRLSLNNAKALLRKFQVPEEEIKKLSRWEVIDVVRTLSTEKAKVGEEGMDKFSRGNRFSIAEHQERYKEECQRIFDLQNRVLASAEVLSTDEGESTASEESDLEELGKNLENMLANKKTSTQLSLEREEQERQELLKKLMEEREGNTPTKNKNPKKEDDVQSQGNPSNHGRILRITRTFKNAEGREYTRVELVRRQPVIDAYMKIRTTKDEAFIRQFATLDDAQKEEMKREKRRIQEQLRRIKRNQEKNSGMLKAKMETPGGPPISLGDRHSLSSQGSQTPGTPGTPVNPNKEISPSRRKIKFKPDLKLKCGACGQVGHMRTNKACALYTNIGPAPSLNVAMTEEQEEEIEKELNADDEDLVNVDGTKVKLSGKLLKRHEDVKRRTLLLKVPKEAVKNKRRRVGLDVHCDYLKKHNKPANRRRTDPVVVMSSILEQILNEMRDLPDVQPFMFPVNAKLVPDYYRIVQRPMDLQSIRENLRQKRYQSREEFLDDVNQIVENSTMYNGPKSPLTQAAQRMLQKCVDRLAEKEERLIRLEKAINPLLDDDDQVALSFIFEKLNNKLKTMTESWPFLKPVNKKQVKDYYMVIRRPMDLETITKKVANHKYHSRAEFLEDIHQIAKNCEQYNGADASFTKQAYGLYDYAVSALHDFDEHYSHYEERIARVLQERAKNEAEFEEDDNDDLSRHISSRNSSPEHDYVDVEGGERPMSSASMGSQKLGPPIIHPLPEIKRSRGRPRKIVNRDLEEVKNHGIKRGRGRPRKDSFTSSLSNTQNSYLDEDLQFSTDDEEFEEVTSDNEEIIVALDQGEKLSIKQEPPSTMDEQQPSTSAMAQSMSSLPNPHPGEDDSQQAAEAMVQLSGIGFYTQPQDESVDLDPNYDPSDFLGGLPSSRQSQQQNQQFENINQDGGQDTQQQQQIQSFSQQQMFNPQQEQQQFEQQISFNDDQQQMFSENIQSSFNSQQQQQHIFMQPQQQQQSFQTMEEDDQNLFCSDQPLLQYMSQSLNDNNQNPNLAIQDDLAVSDSEEEDNLKMEIYKEEPRDTNNDDEGDEGLWF